MRAPRPAAAIGASRSIQSAHRQRPAARAQAGGPGKAGGCASPDIQAHDPAFAIGPIAIPSPGPWLGMLLLRPAPRGLTARGGPSPAGGLWVLCGSWVEPKAVHPQAH